MILQYKNIDVYYEDFGEGEAVVLLHGFLENSSMWTDITRDLQQSNRVISIDLFGHGNTGNIGYVHTMYDMADVVSHVLAFLRIKNFIVIGHSMGGYVALALAKSNPLGIVGLCLMNSTYHADDEERKEVRDKSIVMVRNHYELVVRSSFINLFAEESKVLFQSTIDDALEQALNTSVQGYVAAQRGMRDRDDHFSLIKALKTKKLVILGSKDPIIDGDRIISETRDTDIQIEKLSLGHMSHIENKSEITYIIMRFIEKIYP